MKMTQPRALKPAAMRVSELLDMPTLLGVVKALVGSARLSDAETRILKDVAESQDSLALAAIRAEVVAGKDPLGAAYWGLLVFSAISDGTQS